MLTTNLKSKQIILASASPRRQELLKDLDIDFKVVCKHVEEIYPLHLKKEQITNYLAKLKAVPFKEDLKKNDVLITSDTIVWFNNKALGKPKSKEEAYQMLQSLIGTTHKVITSICVTTKEKQIVMYDTTKVSFKVLKQEELQYYINNYNPLDKAGGYGIQDWIGKIGIEKIEGSYFNVMGFPTHMVYKALLEI